MLFINLFLASAAASVVTTSRGVWTVSSDQLTYSAAVQQPINADGSSNFNNGNGRSVIPVKFELSQGVAPFVFASLTAGPLFSYASFDPNDPVTLNDITQLSAVYSFTTGNCWGGSLRWSIRTSATQALSIYYGVYPNFGNSNDGGCTPTNGEDQSGQNLLNLRQLRFDTTQYGGTFYDTYDHAVTLLGNLPILSAALILDSYWKGDQQLTLGSATFATSSFTDTFTPAPPTSSKSVCPTQPASITIEKISGAPSGPLNEVESIQPRDTNGIFRIVDCKYMYNLATSSLSGVGTYIVRATINGATFVVASFHLK
jgi:hypothetical protein